MAMHPALELRAGPCCQAESHFLLHKDHPKIQSEAGCPQDRPRLTSPLQLCMCRVFDRSILTAAFSLSVTHQRGELTCSRPQLCSGKQDSKLDLRDFIPVSLHSGTHWCEVVRSTCLGLLCGGGVPVEAALVAGGCCRLRQWLLAESRSVRTDLNSAPGVPLLSTGFHSCQTPF